ncbi:MULTISPECIES: Uma2 family endonuclease [Streptacidiphilus]|uniref:Uma2 family endonuclease n=1 Tax=Streptacidiphilus cavernicola TaxID=3342716 RepID=A0ABV6UX46_9ACTN|nr:Uma2 family endonuclease [Streptacidiphilus jeojiense]
MTMLNDRSPILVEQFEAIARSVAREAEGVHMELINGKLGVKPVPDGIHDTIVAWLSRICIQARPELWFYAERGLAVETYRAGRAKADGLLTEGPSFLDDKEWADTAPVLLVAEVTSSDPDTNQRDRIDKPRAYAESGIPVYLLIDRDSCEMVVHSDPDGTRYETVSRRPFGKSVLLPDPVGITLDTEPLKNWTA